MIGVEGRLHCDIAMDERIRQEIYDEAGGLCECGRPGTEIDHIIPKRMGGRHGEAKIAIEAKANKRLICRKCHQRKHG